MWPSQVQEHHRICINSPWFQVSRVCVHARARFEQAQMLAYNVGCIIVRNLELREPVSFIIGSKNASLCSRRHCVLQGFCLENILK